MQSTIARLYATPESARQAAEAVRRNRPLPGPIHVVAPPPSGAAGTPPAKGGVLAELRAANIAEADAPKFAEALRGGGTLVVVVATFGTAVQAIRTLERFGPIDSGVTEDRVERRIPGDNGATPLSDAFGWTVLSDEPAPLSKKLGMPVLSTPARRTTPVAPSKGWTVSSILNIPTLTDSKMSKTSSFGLPLLSDEPAPLSKKLGWAVLRDGAAPLSESMKAPVLVKDPAPLSGAVKAPTIVNDPAPLSGAVNAPTVTDR